MDAQQYRTIGAVADELGIPRSRLAYLIERRAVPDASLHVPGRHLFSPADVRRIRLALASRKQPGEK